MRWPTAVAVVIFAVSGRVQASGYDALGQGWNSEIRSDAGNAVASFGAALDAGDLAPVYISSAHLGRALAYMEEGRCADALPDLDEILKDQPKSLQALAVRARAYICLKNADAAMADYRAIVLLHPDASSDQDFALYLWEIGRFADAAQMFTLELKYLPKFNSQTIFTALWYIISASRTTSDRDAIAKQMANVGCQDIWNGECANWPGPLLNYFQGDIKEDDVYYELKSDDSALAADRTCAADFFIGEWQLLHQRVDAAKADLQKAVVQCRRNTVEYSAARVEIDRLAGGGAGGHG